MATMKMPCAVGTGDGGGVEISPTKLTGTTGGSATVSVNIGDYIVISGQRLNTNPTLSGASSIYYEQSNWVLWEGNYIYTYTIIAQATATSVTISNGGYAMVVTKLNA